MLYHFIAFSAAVATGTADADCRAYNFKINGVCTGVQQFVTATGCGSANGGIDSHSVPLTRAFCEEFGTARVPADQQDPMRSWGNLGKPLAARFAGEVNDPTMPSGCVAHSNQNTYQWNTATGGVVSKWWNAVCMTDDLPAPSPSPMTKCQEVVPDRAMSIKNGGDSVAVQLCKVINGNVMSPMWGGGKNSDCGTDAALILASTNSVDECRALCDAHSLCLGWQLWDQTRLPAPFTKDDQGCYLFGAGTKDQLVPDRVLGGEEVAAGTCFPAPPAAMTKCKEVVPDRAMSIKNGGDSVAVQLCKVINGNVMSPMWGGGKNSDCGTDAALILASTNSVDECRALCDAHALCLGWQLWDQTRLPAPFTKDDQGCYLFGSGTKDQLVPDRIMGGEEVAAGTCFPETAAPPTEPPTTCDCRQTAATYAEGARCMGPHQESIGYRKTANWCCSDYGCSKGYKWVNPADSQCHDDTFVGTCMFNYIQNGGCNAEALTDDVLLVGVDPACFTCDHIGELVDQECMGGSPSPIHILNDMIDDARRLAGAPLPAGDNQLAKIKRRISKIRTLLREKKQAAKNGLNGSG